MKELIIGFICVAAFSSVACASVCVKKNGLGVDELKLVINEETSQISLAIPESDKIGLAVTITESYVAGDFYGMDLFHDDGAVTYSARIGTDAVSDYVLYTTAGDIDAQTSFYRCPKSGMIMD